MEEHIRVGVVFFCHDGKGRALLHKRSTKCKDEHGRWDCGGGGVDFGESFDEAVYREVKEEYAADILHKKFLGFREVHREEKGKKSHWICFDYLVIVDPDSVENREPEKIEEIGWFPLDKFPEPLHSQFPIFFEKYRKELSQI